jgi:hypothetical protein
MNASNYLETAILNLVFRNTAFTPPANVYVALHTADPTDAATAGTEVTGNAYARVSVTTTGGWTAPVDSGTSKLTDNVNPITFPLPTPAGWGTLTHFSIWDAPTGGNMLVSAPLAAAKTINAGDTVQFAAGDLDITSA